MAPASQSFSRPSYSQACDSDQGRANHQGREPSAGARLNFVAQNPWDFESPAKHSAAIIHPPPVESATRPAALRTLTVPRFWLRLWLLRLPRAPPALREVYATQISPRAFVNSSLSSFLSASGEALSAGALR